MKRVSLMLAAAAMVLFSSCNKEKEVSISFTSDNIVVDLGSTAADLAKFAKASDESSVTVSGVDFEKIGEQTATFKAGSASVDKTVKVSAKRLAGNYRIHILDSAGTKELTEGNGWRMDLTPGAEYNQIDIPAAVGEKKIFKDVEKITVTFKDGKGSIPTYKGDFAFIGGSGYTCKFQNITYGKNSDGMYALKGFTLKFTQQGYDDFYEQVRFDKLDEPDEE